MRRTVSLILAGVLILSTISGCAAPVVSTPEESIPATSESASEAAAYAAPVPSPERTISDAPDDPAPDSEDLPEVSAEIVFPASIGDIPENEEPIAASAEQMDRLSRTYSTFNFTPSAYFINNAPKYYYYEQISPNVREIYDAMYNIFTHPETSEATCAALLDYYPEDDFNRFFDDENTAYYALMYDHPELYWVRQSSTRAYCTYYDRSDKSISGTFYYVYFQLKEAHPEANSYALNLYNQAQLFLALVPSGLSADDTIREVHDLIVTNCQYDYDTCNFKQNYDLAHTAYGCLCNNTAGQAFTAVCDGYSLGFNYLLQQLGFETAVVTGYVDNDITRLHAWSMVKANGSWHEYDVTWDDHGDWINDISPSVGWYSAALAAWNSSSYQDKVSHAYYRLSTAKMNNFNPGNTYRFTNQNWYFSLIGSSTRARDTYESSPARRILMTYAPIAK